MDMVNKEKEYTAELERMFTYNTGRTFKRIELLHNFNSNSYKYAFSAADDKNCFYAIPMCTGNVMKYDAYNGKLSFIPGIVQTDFAYTGGAFDRKRNCIWGFPRNSDYLLKIHTDEDKAEEIPLNMKFNSTGIHGGHHYSGVLVEDTVFCPPRPASSGILKIDLLTYQASLIPMDKIGGRNYSGSMLHPNGKIYFFPSPGDRITVFDPVSESMTTIGEKTDAFNFGGVVWKDGNIYCFTSKNVIRINTHEDTVENICPFPSPIGFYGCALHPNGKIYGFGNNNVLTEFDPATGKLAYSAKFYDGAVHYSSATMGQVMSDGNIYLTPCQGRFFMRCVFE